MPHTSAAEGTLAQETLAEERTALGLAQRARAASRVVATLPAATKDAVLRHLADALGSRAADLLAANERDLAAARGAGLAEAKLRRLSIDAGKLAEMAEGVRQIAAMPDPVNGVSRAWGVPSGLRVEKVRTPLGVVAMIYEARPNVTIDAFALCFKAGNACILKGGREANETNAALARLVRASLAAHGCPEAAVTQVTTSDREELKALLRLEGLIDLVIPRGGEGLIRFVHEHSRIPTVLHFHGVCHLFVDEHADAATAANLAVTGKTSAPAACNALECLLVHERAPAAFFAEFLARCPAGVTVHADGAFLDRCRAAGGVPAHWQPATDADWGHEYLDLHLAARMVGSMDEAIAHIARYGSNHTDAIVTADAANAGRFCREVQSSCVLVNASTRFNDGFQLGLGAEIGISTSKIHCYGPMGLEGLTTERFVVRGAGQVR